MTHARCDHIGLLSQNAGELTAFYTEVLGFEITAESTLPESIVQSIFGLSDECRFVKLHKDGFMIEIFQPLSAGLSKWFAGVVGINHWGYCVDDRNAFVDKMRRDGHQLVEIDRTGRSVYFLIDPDGNRIEIRECPR